MLGRRRVLPKINHKDFKERSHTERQAVNFTIQGLYKKLDRLYGVLLSVGYVVYCFIVLSPLLKSDSFLVHVIRYKINPHLFLKNQVVSWTMVIKL